MHITTIIPPTASPDRLSPSTSRGFYRGCVSNKRLEVRAASCAFGTQIAALSGLAVWSRVREEAA